MPMYSLPSEISRREISLGRVALCLAPCACPPGKPGGIQRVHGGKHGGRVVGEDCIGVTTTPPNAVRSPVILENPGGLA